MKRIVPATVLAAFAALAAAQTPSDFAWRAPLALAGDRPFHRIELPADVYRHAVRADLGDVRVFAADGTPVAFAFLPPAPPRSERPAPVSLPVFPLRVDADRTALGDLSIRVRKDASGTSVDLSTRDGAPVGGTRVAGYLVDTGELREPLTALTLPLAGADLNTRIHVEGSDDLVAWRPLGRGPLLRLEVDGRQLVRNRVEIAPFAGKYLRLAFDPGQPVIDVQGLTGEFAERVVDAPRQWIDVVGVPVADKSGAYDFDLGGAFPVDRIELALPEVNTVAPARWFVRAAPTAEWRPVASGVAYRLRQDGGDVAAPPLAVAAGPARYWRVELDARAGGMGQGAVRLRAGWTPQVLVFAARGTGPFELAFGSARVQPAALPIASLVPGFDRATGVTTMPVAVPAAVPLAGSASALQPPADVKRWALWASLVVAVVVLGGMAWRLSREMASSTPPADPPSRPESGA